VCAAAEVDAAAEAAGGGKAPSVVDAFLADTERLAASRRGGVAKSPTKGKDNGKGKKGSCQTTGRSRHVETYIQHFTHFQHHFPRGTLPS